MSYIDDKINRQDYLEIQNMLAKNAQRRRAEDAKGPRPMQKSVENRMGRSPVTFERVPREDEFIRGDSRRTHSRDAGRRSTQKQRRPEGGTIKRASGSKYESKHSSEKSPVIDPKGAAVSAACLLAIGTLIAGGAGANEVQGAQYFTKPDDGVKPIVDETNYDVDSRYEERFEELGISSSDAVEPPRTYAPEPPQATDEAASIVYDAPPKIEEEPQAVAPTEVSDVMLDYLKSRESFEPVAYRCPAGKLTIGWGHTAGVYEGQTTTEEEATQFLRDDLDNAENCVIEEAEKYGVILTQGQFDAFVDFAFNLGNGGFKDSGLMQLMADDDLEGAIAQIKKYVKAKDPDTGELEVLGGLVARREMEAEWMLS